MIYLKEIFKSFGGIIFCILLLIRMPRQYESNRFENNSTKLIIIDLQTGADSKPTISNLSLFVAAKSSHLASTSNSFISPQPTSSIRKVNA